MMYGPRERLRVRPEVVRGGASPRRSFAVPSGCARGGDAWAGCAISPVAGSMPYFVSIRIQRGAFRKTMSAS